MHLEMAEHSGIREDDRDEEMNLLNMLDMLNEHVGNEKDILDSCQIMLQQARERLKADGLLLVVRPDFCDPSGELLVVEALGDETTGSSRRDPSRLCQLLKLGTDTLLPVDLTEMNGETAPPVLSGWLNDGRHVLLLPLHGPAGEYAVLVLAVENPPHPWPLYKKELIPQLHLFAMGLFDQVMRTFRERRGIARAKFSEREFECLYWCAQGKSYWETAIILGIAERTVNHYMKMVRQKLGVQTNAQAVCLAAARGLFKGHVPSAASGPKRTD